MNHMDEFYHLNNCGQVGLSSRWEFWFLVAVQWAKRDKQRAQSARKVAQHARLLARTSTERDEKYRLQIEALKAKQ